MRTSPWLILGVFLLAAAPRPAIAAESSTRLLNTVPAGAPLVLHIRSLPELIENWQHTPYAKMWGDPEVRAFFAPAIGLMATDSAKNPLTEFENTTGLKPMEFVALFPGEFVVALVGLPDGPESKSPSVVVGARLGGNRAKIEAVLKKAREKRPDTDKETILEEEFQGETLHVTVKQGVEAGEKSEAEAWAIVDDVFWIAQPKAALQQAIANWKRGGATAALAASAGFASIYQRSPGAQASVYFNLEAVVQLVLQTLERQEAAKAANAAPGAQPSPLEAMGLKSAAIVHALGVDALRSMHATLTIEKKATTLAGGLTWTEQRGLLKMFAYGDPPAPQPGFVSPAWSSVSSVRFSVAQVFESIKEIARTANPMFEFMLMQQVTGLNQQLGVDIERDFFGSFGDEIVFADSLEDLPGNPIGSEKLGVLSLANAEAFGRVLDAILGLAPGVASQFQDREYLGQTIRTITLPMPAAGGMSAMEISYAITPRQLLLDIGGSGMIETAIRGLNGDSPSFWAQPAVVAALQQLPPGGSSFTYQDVRKVVVQSFSKIAQLAAAAAAAPESDEEPAPDEDGGAPRAKARPGKKSPGLGAMVDPNAVPREETIAKYLSTSASAVYRESDGFRFVARVNHVE